MPTGLLVEAGFERHDFCVKLLTSAFQLGVLGLQLCQVFACCPSVDHPRETLLAF
jgi:hypothetical protein